MNKCLFFFVVSLLIWNTTKAQIGDVPPLDEVSQNLAWFGIGVKKNIKDSIYAHHIKISFQSRRKNWGKDHALAIGLINYSCTSMKSEFGFFIDLASGDVARLGVVSAINVGVTKTFKTGFLNPTIRLSGQEVWFLGGQNFDVEKPKPAFRLRSRIVGKQPMNKKKKLFIVISTEVFLFKQHSGTFKEVRSFLGPHFQFNNFFGADLFYWNRWAKNDKIRLIEHAVWLNLSFTI